MEEMRQLINKRSGEVTPISHHGGPREAATATGNGGRTTELLKSIEESVSEADKGLVRAAASQEALSINVSLLAADLKEVSPILMSPPSQRPTFCHVTESQSSRKVSRGTPEYQAPVCASKKSSRRCHSRE
jgi:hypothetical protein